MPAISWTTGSDVDTHSTTDSEVQTQSGSGLIEVKLAGQLFGESFSGWTAANNDANVDTTEAGGTLTQTVELTESYDSYVFTTASIPNSTACSFQIDFSSLSLDAGGEAWFTLHDGTSEGGSFNALYIGRIANDGGTQKIRARKIVAGGVTNLGTSNNSQTSGKFRIVLTSGRLADFDYHNGSDWVTLVSGHDYSAVTAALSPGVVCAGSGTAAASVVWDNLIQNSGGAYWPSTATYTLAERTWAGKADINPASFTFNSVVGTHRIRYRTRGADGSTWSSYSDFMTTSDFLSEAVQENKTGMQIQGDFNNGGQTAAASIGSITGSAHSRVVSMLVGARII